jgi:hypothetical protein
MAYRWELFPGAVAVNDGTRQELEIQRPGIEPQQLFYIDIQSGFLGQNNDSGQFYMMPRIGPGEELHLPHGLYILPGRQRLP